MSITSGYAGKAPLPQALDYQNIILPGVSRTFALTIPQLPGDLANTVGNAYLLCRIADTIEDEAGLSQARKQEFHQRFIEVVAGREPAENLSRELMQELLSSATQKERNLIQNMHHVVATTQSFDSRQQQALQKCVRIMCRGMSEFQDHGHENGLANVGEMNRYCYFVAGVVGEMLTELFCDHAEDIDRHYRSLMQLAPSFGQGLQMTNILKDIWDDQQRAMCWLPASLFNEAGYDTRNIKHQLRDEHFVAGLQQLIKLANAHLNNALSYTLTIPDRHVGIRRFCLWALGMAVMTLRKINQHPDFESSQQVKISRRMVKWVVGVSNTLTRRDGSLQTLYRRFSKALDQSPADIRALLPDYSIISQWHQPVEIIPALAIDRQAT